MEEQKIVRKQLLKNMLYTFITFTVIFTLFDILIYNLISTSVYTSIDKEIMYAKEQVEAVGNEPTSQNTDTKKKTYKSLNPRLIYIVRDENGEITNKENIGRFYEDYITDIAFDKEFLNQIYLTSIDDTYYYRGINVQIVNQDTKTTKYIQIIVNVDGENQSVSNILRVLVIATIIIIFVSIIISFILSSRTLKPIIEALNRQTEFVQNASHELRTPLTIIQAKQELLLQEPNKKIIDKSKDITVCIKETRRLSKLVKELMTLARADSNKLDLNKEIFNLDSLIKEVSEPYIEMANMQHKEVSLDLNCNKDLKADKNKITELLIIILDNAIKYTGEKDKINIKTFNKDGKIYIEISDTGIGISKEAMKHIFERFYREDKTRSRETGGNGLGLAIAQTIVKAHNGSIKLLHNEPKGTKVIIKL